MEIENNILNNLNINNEQNKFVNSTIGKVINNAIDMGLRHVLPDLIEEENIKILSEFTNLSEKEKVEIKSLKRGECLMFVGENKILTKIEADEVEKEIIEKIKFNN